MAEHGGGPARDNGLQERNRHLEEVIRQTQEALELVSDLGDFQASLNALEGPEGILATADDRVRRVTDFEATAWLLINEEDATFGLARCEPPEAEAGMRAELDRLTDNKTVALALDSPRPVRVATADGRGRLMLQVLATASRIRGLFLGRLARDPAEIPDSFVTLLTIILQGCANTIESHELYGLNRRTTLRLEEKVAQLMQAEARLRAKSMELEDMVSRLRLENSLHLTAREELHEASREARAATEALERLTAEQEELIRERTMELTRKTSELTSANRKLKRLDELKSAFLSAVSHDIRTPLTSVLGFAKLALRDFERHYLPLAGDDRRLAARGDRLRDNLAVIVSEGERLTRLINDFLDLSRIESGRQPWKDTDMDPATALDTAVRAVSGDYEAKPSVDLEVRAATGLPRLHADPDRIVQVLVNLLHNAIKFTDQGRVVAGVEAADGKVRYTVADTGIGIPAEEMESVFDKFHQLAGGDRVSERARGSGLGLSICREIVEHYGGSIWADSSFGRGSTFVVELPGLP